MKNNALHLAATLSILIVSFITCPEAMPAPRTDPCAGPPFGMSPAALAFWKEGIIDPAIATASMQDICRMKTRQASRKSLHELGFSDEIIDRASPLSLMYQRMGALRFAAQLPDDPNPRQSQAVPSGSGRQLGSGSIRLEDIRISEKRFQQEHFGLRQLGQMSDDLMMLARLGVRFEDSGGHARDFGEVAIDTAAAIQRAIANKTLTASEAEYAAREAGFYGSVARAVATNDPGLESALKFARTKAAPR